MVRTQIMLTEHQHRFLKEVALDAGVSLAEVVRQAVQQMMKEQRHRGWESARELYGAWRDDAGDVSDKHDDYLVEAFEE
jgi:Arc/MetJ-type ribon-helix-helix transcriptional regulator